MSHARFSRCCLFGLAMMHASCTDPVRDQQIEALGEEVGEPGPEHRPGQPCLLCHSQGGPAADKSFKVAGTIFETNEPGSPGADGVVVEMIDANGLSPTTRPTTNRAGNFWVTNDEWSDLEFPFRVRIFPKGAPEPLRMETTVNREGSCNYCHRPFPKGPLSEGERQVNRSSVGQIYVKTVTK